MLSIGFKINEILDFMSRLDKPHSGLDELLDLFFRNPKLRAYSLSIHINKNLNVHQECFKLGDEECQNA